MSELHPDPDRLKMFSFTLYTQLAGAVTAGMVHLGDRLGLYRALAESSGPLDSSALAKAAGLHERWVREWASNQVAARLIEADYSDPLRPSFSLTPEARAVLADDRHPAFGMGMFHRLPQTMERLSDLPECFVSGVGFDYDAHGHEGAVGIERSFEPWSNANLVPVVVPAINGLRARLDEGIAVADIGCGAGSAVCTLAAEFPRSRFVGYDISQHALIIAREKAASKGLRNVRFVDAKHEPVPSVATYDFISTFDCIHDMTHPSEMIKSIRRALKDDGVWLLVDIKALETLQQNVTKNPMAALMYGISVLSCMASALSESGGEGLGTLGLPATRAESYARTAGFTSFEMLPIEHSVNAFYEIRP